MLTIYVLPKSNNIRQDGQRRRVFDPARASQWLRNRNLFQELLICLVNLLSGQPARATEIGALIFKNLLNGTNGCSLYISVFVTSFRLTQFIICKTRPHA